MYLSYNEACGRDCSSLEEDLELCEKAGFDFIEIRFDMLQPYLEKHSLSELRDFFQTSRLKPHALNALYLYDDFLGPEDDPQKQAELMKQFIFGCEACREIGSKYMIVVPPLQPNPAGGPYMGTREKTKENCVRILDKLGQIAESYGVNLCFELVGFERSSVRSIREVADIVETVGRGNVGYVFDSYNLYLNGGLNDFSELKTVSASKIFAVHLMNGDDVPEQERGQDKRRFCGSGVVDIPAFLETLKSIGYNGMLSVETFRPEYWQRTPDWVVSEAYRTTYGAAKESGCL